jgi:hypothetical protein
MSFALKIQVSQTGWIQRDDWRVPCSFDGHTVIKCPNSITRVIEFDEIRDYFPSDTPLVTKEDRREAIAARQAVVGQRFKP